MHRVIGIDPGYERLGVAIVEQASPGAKEELVYSTCIRTSSKDDFVDRLALLGRELAAVIDEWQPSRMAIEDIFFTTNQKTVIRVAEAKGVILYVARTAGLSVEQYTPLQIKQAITGYGRATKQQIQDMIPRLIAADLSGKIDDEIDAIAVSLTALAYRT